MNMGNPDKLPRNRWM